MVLKNAAQKNCEYYPDCILSIQSNIQKCHLFVTLGEKAVEMSFWEMSTKLVLTPCKWGKKYIDRLGKGSFF